MKNDLTVTYVSHACLRIDGEFGSLLCDPWFLNEPVYDYVLWKFPPAVIPPDVLLKNLDYLYITHSHEDHFHIPSINKIRRDIRVLLPEYTNHPCLRAQLVERVLREMGFHRITKIQPWETYLLGGNTPFTVVPSAKSRSHDWENSGFVLDHPGSRLINMNDNCDDEELCSEIHERWPGFDIGFIQTSSATVFPACYRMSGEAKEHAVSNKNETFTLHKRLIEMLSLQRIVPFAGDFGWYDDRYFSYNRQGRSTPKILENWIRRNYPDREVATLYPSDTWSVKTGVIRNHPDVDWGRHLDFVKVCKQKFQNKVDCYNAWIDASDRTNLLQRSRLHTDTINKHITQNGIVFSGRFRIVVEGDHSNFSFVLKANPQDGFAIDWEDRKPVDQSIYVSERLWAAILEGKIMWGMYQWATEIEEHVPYRLDLGRFWYWLEYNLDLGNKNSQAIMEPRLYPHLTGPTIRPQWGTMEFDDDWEFPWMNGREPVIRQTKPSRHTAAHETQPI
jgi:hypothetical protein